MHKTKKLLCYLIMGMVLTLSDSLVFAAVLEGQLFERGTRKTLKDVHIFILPHKLKALTDANGNYKFENLPDGEFEIIINLPGYQKLELKDAFNAENASRKRILYLEKVSYSGFETTIVASKQRRDDSKKSLRQDQFLNLPGSGGDPVKAVQNLPGVNRVGGFSSQVVIQGSAPKDTAYNADGHNIPLVFHFGGLSSVIMPEALESVDYLSAGYGSEYSRALGGIVSLQTRKPDVSERKSKGFFFIDTLKAGGLYEAQIDEKSSFLVSGRYSYFGLILGKVLEKNEDFNLTVAPEYSDFTGIYSRKLSDSDDLKVVTLASRDYLGFLLKQPVKSEPSLRGNFNNETIFYRLIPQWSRRIDEDQNLKFSVGVGQNQVLVDIGENFFRMKSDSLTTRGEWEKKWTSAWTTQTGFDNEYSQTRYSTRLPSPSGEGGVSDPFSSSEIRETEVKGKTNDIGLYFRNEYVVGNWTALPSVRADAFSQTKEKLLSPRLGFRYKYSESLGLKAAGGIYQQAPETQETDPTFGNPDVKSPKAYHLTFGFEKDYRDGRKEGYSLNGAYFDRMFDKLVIPSAGLVLRDGQMVRENYNNQGAGRAYGIEMQLKFEEVPYTGWLSYTWSKSVRWNPYQAEYNYEYDQTHNINLVASRDLGRNWKISGRLRYVTGNPMTPIASSTFDSDNDVYIPVRGPIYSERQGPFSQLDLRFDKKFILDREIWSLYIDVQNALNQKNPEGYQYSYNYKEKEAVTGLPILPSIGIKGEF